MSDLPTGWEWARLDELVTINPRRFDEQPVDEELLSLVPMASVEAESGRMDASQTIRYGDAKKKSLTPFQENDVLFAKVTPCMENGKIAVACSLVGGRGLGSTELFALRSHGAIRPDYLAHFLLQHAVRKAAQAAMIGAVGLRRVPRSYLASLSIPVPPLAEQRRIVVALEGHLSRLDAGTELATRAEARLPIWESALANAATHGAAGHQRKGALSGWEERAIGEIARVGTGATPRRSEKRFYSGGTIPWVTSSAVNQPYINSATEFITDEALAETSVKLWPAGTLLMAMYGEGRTRGRCSELGIAATTNQACAAINLKPEWENRRAWIKLSLQASYEKNRQLASGGVQPNLNLSLIRSIKIAMPPIDEQDRILSEFTRQQNLAARLAAALKSTNLQSKHLRASLLREAFAGRLVQQDPDDEPASELLARIRAGQAAAIPRQRTGSRRARNDLAAPPTRVTGDDFQQEELPL